MAEPHVIPQDDKAVVAGEIQSVWQLHHAPLHPTLSLDSAMKNPVMCQILKAHALLNIKHKMGVANVAH